MIIHNTTPRGVQSYSRARPIRSSRSRLDFAKINAAALVNSIVVLQRLLPGGKRQGTEYIVKNPRRADGKPGSFKINMKTGRWCDFAIGQGGGDLIALAAYVLDVRQGEAARRLAEMLHLKVEVRR